MFLLRRTHRRLVLELQRLLEARRHELVDEMQKNVRLTIRLELVEQARQKADEDVAYWRQRAEKFIDQVGVNTGMISAPTMAPAPEPPESQMAQVFTALGTSELHSHPSPDRAASAAPVVRGVDPAAAHAAVHDLISM